MRCSNRTRAPPIQFAARTIQVHRLRSAESHSGRAHATRAGTAGCRGHAACRAAMAGHLGAARHRPRAVHLAIRTHDVDAHPHSRWHGNRHGRLIMGHRRRSSGASACCAPGCISCASSCRCSAWSAGLVWLVQQPTACRRRPHLCRAHSLRPRLRQSDPRCRTLAACPRSHPAAQASGRGARVLPARTRVPHAAAGTGVVPVPARLRTAPAGQPLVQGVRRAGRQPGRPPGAPACARRQPPRD
jgi:hypothetical protein